MIDSIPFLLSGLGYTIGISFAAFFLGNLLGIMMTVLNYLPIPPVQWFVRFYLSFLRGTPALVLLFLLYFGLPYQLNAVLAAVICFSLTSSAFIGEIYRGSIAGVNAGQWDAAYALGNRFFPMMRYIILPQALRKSTSNMRMLSKLVIISKHSNWSLKQLLVNMVYMRHLCLNLFMESMVQVCTAICLYSMMKAMYSMMKMAQ